MKTYQTLDGIPYEVGYGSNCPPGTKGGQHVSRDYVWWRKVGDTSGIYEGWQVWSGSMHSLVEALENLTETEFLEWVSDE